MNQTLLQTKTAAIEWATSLIPTLSFIIATSPFGRRQWQEQQTNKVVSIPSESGIYLVYPLTLDIPVYIGEASDLCRRVTYHFAESKSSDNESTLKKNLRRDGHYTSGSLSSIFRIRILPLSFGRTEIEEHLHAAHKVNTGRVTK